MTLFSVEIFKMLHYYFNDIKRFRAQCKHQKDSDMAKMKKDGFEKDFELFSKVCAQKGLRLTPLRAQVWECLHRLARPAGAYDIVKSLESAGSDAPPVSVYRVLDFLAENGFAHRLPESNAYMPCKCLSEKHSPAFLMCSVCGGVEEIDADKALKELKKAAGKFKMKSASVVVEGVCAQCRK